MTRFAAALLFATLTLPVWATAAHADADSCRKAIEQFDKAQGAVAAAIVPYSDCIAYSDGHQRCGGQFTAVQKAQTQYQTAIALFEGDCTN